MPNIYDDKIYSGVLEARVIKEILETFQNLFFYELDSFQANQFLLTAGEPGIAEAEEMFGIIPNYVTESLEFRRQRVLNRNTAKPPYTYRYLKHRLDEILGIGKYTMNRDPNSRTLYIESSVESSMWYNEISVTVNKLKPANMIYINMPYIKYGMQFSETIDYGHRLYNYKLGTRWRLGRLPFVLFEEEDNAKMPGIKSINDNYLNAVAGFTAAEVAAIRVNGAIVITELIKESTGNTGTIEYGVATEQTAEITKLELLSAASTVLTSSAVYIPVTDPVRIKHKIIVKEGS